MGEIIIKALNDAYVVKLGNEEFYEIKNELSKRLQICASLKGGTFEAFFDIKREVNSEYLYSLFTLCKEYHICVLGFKDQKSKLTIKIMKEPLHSGQDYFFVEPILLLGNIPRDTYVCCYESIYVMGEICGKVDVIHKDSSVNAAICNHAFIRIHDSAYVNVTNYAPLCLYYNKRSIILKAYKTNQDIHDSFIHA
ncbi:MAG: hypothetical protein RSC93_03555 [Erysipelotrichaceae bacterium]